MKPCGCPALPSRLRWLGTLTLLLGGLAQPLAAQLKSVPVYPLLAVRQGWAAGLDFGSGLNDASGHARHLGARVGGGAGRLFAILCMVAETGANKLPDGSRPKIHPAKGDEE